MTKYKPAADSTRPPQSRQAADDARKVPTKEDKDAMDVRAAKQALGKPGKRTLEDFERELGLD